MINNCSYYPFFSPLTGRDIGPLQLTRTIRRGVSLPSSLSGCNVYGIRENATVLSRISRTRLVALRSDFVHGEQTGVRQQADESTGSNAKIDQVSSVQGTLRLRQRKLYKRFVHLRQGSI